MRNKIVSVIIMEEVHLLASEQKMKRQDLGEPLIVRQLRLSRKHGVSNVVVDQTPGALPRAILANLSTRIAFHLGNPSCIWSISNSMGLDRTQAAEIAKLPERMAVVQTSDIPEPFVLRVVDIPESEKPSEEEIGLRIKESLALLDHEFADVSVTDVLLGIEKDGEEGEGDDNAVKGDTLKVLARICGVPHELIEERAESLRIGRGRESRARKKLEALGMIELGDKVGAKWQLYVPTARGTGWAEGLGLPVHRYKSGIAHEFMLKRVRQALGSFCQRVSFVSEGRAIGDTGIQPDLTAHIRRERGGPPRVIVIQISCSNKPDYEARKAVKLSRIKQIDMVLVIAKNKGARNVLEDRIRRLVERERARSNKKRNPAGSDSTDSEGASMFDAGAGSGPFILDFETCVSAEYDWGWVIE